MREVYVSNGSELASVLVKVRVYHGLIYPASDMGFLLPCRDSSPSEIVSSCLGYIYTVLQSYL